MTDDNDREETHLASASYGDDADEEWEDTRVDNGIVKVHSERITTKTEDDNEKSVRIEIKDEHAFEIKEIRVSMQCDITTHISAPFDVKALNKLVSRSNEELLNDNMKRLDEVVSELEVEHDKKIDQLKSGHKTELANTVAELEQSIASQMSKIEHQCNEKFQEQLAKELSRQREIVEEELGNTYEEKIKQLKEDHEATIRQLKEDHENHLARLIAEHETSLHESSLRIEMQLDEMRKQTHEQCEQSFATEMEILKESLRKAEEALQTEITSSLEKNLVIDELKKRHEAEMLTMQLEFEDKLKTERTNAKEEAYREHNVNSTELADLHERTLRSKVAEMEQKIEEERSKCNQDWEKKFDQEMARLLAVCKAHEENLREKEDEVVSMRQKLLEEHQTVEDDLKRELSEKNIEINDLRTKLSHHQTSLDAEVREKYREELVKQHQIEQENLKHQIRIDYEAQHEADMARYKEEWIVELKRTFEANYEAMQSDLVKKHMAEVEDIEQNHKQLLQRMRDECTQELKRKFEAEKELLERQLELKDKELIETLQQQSTHEGEQENVVNNSYHKTNGNINHSQSIEGDQEKLLTEKNLELAQETLENKYKNDLDAITADYEARLKIAEENFESAKLTIEKNISESLDEKYIKQYEDARRQMVKDITENVERQKEEDKLLAIHEFKNKYEHDIEELRNNYKLLEEQLNIKDNRIKELEELLFKYQRDNEMKLISANRRELNSTTSPKSTEINSKLFDSETKDIWDLLEELPSSYENLLNPVSLRSVSGETWNDNVFQLSEESFDLAEHQNVKDGNNEDEVIQVAADDLLLNFDSNNCHGNNGTLSAEEEVKSLKAELETKNAFIDELNKYIEELLVKIMDSTPRLLQSNSNAFNQTRK